MHAPESRQRTPAHTEIDPTTQDLPVPCRVVIDHDRLRPPRAFRQLARDPNHPENQPLFGWFQETPVGHELYLALYTQGCEWARCSFCTLPTRSSPGPVASSSIVDQGLSAIERLSPGQRFQVRRLFLSNNGSVLNPDTMPRDALHRLLREAHLRLPNLAIVCFETRLETVRNEDLIELHALFTLCHRGSSDRLADRPSQIQISAGYETQDPFLRNRILHKGYPERQVQEFFARYASASDTCGYRLLLDENVLLKPAAGLTAEESIREAVETIVHLHRLGSYFDIPISIRLHPTFVAKGSPLAGQFARSAYDPPSLEDCVEVLRRAAARGVRPQVFVGLDDEGLALEGGLFGGRERTRLALRAFNTHQSVSRLVRETQ